jgi:DNA-binding NarL/FixJ family response regulator
VSGATTGPARVLVVDAQRVFAEALGGFVDRQPGLTTVRVTTSADESVAYVGHDRPDVVLVGVDAEPRAPDAADPDDRLALTRRLLSVPDPPVVGVLSGSRDLDLLAEAARLGVRTWVSKEESAAALLRRLRGALAGESAYPATLLGGVLERLASGQQRRAAAATLLDRLSPREREVTGYLVHGLSRTDIAARLVLSPHTVRTHVNHVLVKLEVHSTLGAVAVARASGMGAEPGPPH